MINYNKAGAIFWSIRQLPAEEANIIRTVGVGRGKREVQAKLRSTGTINMPESSGIYFSLGNISRARSDAHRANCTGVGGSNPIATLQCRRASKTIPTFYICHQVAKLAKGIASGSVIPCDPQGDAINRGIRGNVRGIEGDNGILPLPRDAAYRQVTGKRKIVHGVAILSANGVEGLHAYVRRGGTRRRCFFPCERGTGRGGYRAFFLPDVTKRSFDHLLARGKRFCACSSGRHREIGFWMSGEKVPHQQRGIRALWIDESSRWGSAASTPGVTHPIDLIV